MCKCHNSPLPPLILRGGETQSGGVTPISVDIIALYKQAFFEAYGHLLTEIVEAGPYCDLRAMINITTEEVMALRSKFRDGEDTEEDWLNALMKLIAAANNAAGFIGFAPIALRASSLVVDGAKIMRKMKIIQELGTRDSGLVTASGDLGSGTSDRQKPSTGSRIPGPDKKKEMI